MRDSNPRRQCQLIYSQIPLAAWVTRHALPTNVFINRVRVTTIVHGGRAEIRHLLRAYLVRLLNLSVTTTPQTSAPRAGSLPEERAGRYDSYMADSSFDIVSKVDPMELQNAVTQAQKELTQRYDFKGVDPEIDHKGETLTLYATSEERVKAVLDVLQSKLVKRGISLKSLELSDPELQGKRYKISGAVKNGIASDQAKKISQIIREEGPKSAKAQIQGDELRVSSKSRDDLQTIIALLKGKDLDVDLQFVNYR